MNKLILIAISLLTSSAVYASSEISEGQKKKIMQEVEELRLEHDIRGMAITTFTSKGQQLSFGLGYSDKKSEVKAYTPDKTLARVGSVTKMATSLATFLLIERGKYDLDDTLDQLNKALFHKVVSKKCPEKMANLKKITIQHLLNHTSGIAQDLPEVTQWFTSASAANGKQPTIEDFKKYFCEIEFVYEPGQIPAESKYSNMGFNLLAQIIEAYSGTKSYETFIRKNIFKPLAMKDSDYNLNEEQKKKLTWTFGSPGSLSPSSEKGRTLIPKVTKQGSYMGSVAMNSTSEDLAKFGQELLNWTVNPSAAKFGKHWQTQLKAASDNWGTSVLASGFMIRDTKDENFPGHKEGFICYGHTGTAFGARTIVYACPQLNWGFAATFNVRNANRDLYMRAVSQKLMDIGVLSDQSNELSQEVKQWVKDSRDFIYKDRPAAPELVVEKTSKAPESLRDYPGVYYSDVNGKSNVEYVQYLNPETGDIEEGLKYLGGFLRPDPSGQPDMFRFPKEIFFFGHSGEKVEFIRDGKGKVVKIKAATALYSDKISEL